MLGTFNPRNGVICAATALALHIFRHVITKARNIIQSTLAKLNVDPHTHTLTRRNKFSDNTGSSAYLECVDAIDVNGRLSGRKGEKRGIVNVMHTPCS